MDIDQRQLEQKAEAWERVWDTMTELGIRDMLTQEERVARCGMDIACAAIRRLHEEYTRLKEGE